MRDWDPAALVGHGTESDVWVDDLAVLVLDGNAVSMVLEIVLDVFFGESFWLASFSGARRYREHPGM